MKKLPEHIHRVGLVANPDKPSCRALVRKAVALIEASGRQALPLESTAQLAELDRPAIAQTARLVRRVDLLMVFGGDGTMLRVAREIAGSATPILGINAGGLGFLTGVQSHQMPLALKQIWAGETELDSRPLIRAQGTAQGRPFRLTALNDFVISRGAAPRLTDIEVSVDGESLTHYRCDGLIVCSPTGSTTYSLAAGGAVVCPSAEVFTLTPICPHTLSNRSVIVSLRSTVRVRVLSRKVETFLTADGQSSVPLSPQDEITIDRGRHSIRLLHLRGSSFFHTLRQKLQWSGSHVR